MLVVECSRKCEKTSFYHSPHYLLSSPFLPLPTYKQYLSHTGHLFVGELSKLAPTQGLCINHFHLILNVFLSSPHDWILLII